MLEKKYQIKWEGEELVIKTGKLALQTNASVLVQYGETTVLGTVVLGDERDGGDFLPLIVDVEEKLYAAGIIKGSRWVKREGRPTDDAVLTARMIDRTIRPLFNQELRRDIQVILTVLSVDQKNDYDIVSFIAASTALAISGADWRGPVGAIRVGRKNGEFIFNPQYDVREESDLDLIVAGTPDKVIMIEAGANEVNEEDFILAIQEGQKRIGALMDFINTIKDELGAPVNEVLIEQSESVEKTRIKHWLNENIPPILFDKEYYKKYERKSAIKEIKKQLVVFLTNEFGEKVSELERLAVGMVDKDVERMVSEAIIENKKRADGRSVDQIRPLIAEAALLPRVHGSSLFMRGETQVMSIVTLGAPGLYQMLEGVEGISEKHYMHHYNFLPFSVGEAKPLRGAGRREVGHGALAEKALIPVLPLKEEFPYTIRVVSETLGSNGSSSMASVCASSLALMDAGVPIKKPVAGIAIGLASNDDMSKWEVITDLQDMEDGKGGMDFKVAGTRDGITVIQLDTKTDGLVNDIVVKAFEMAKKARLEILDVMGGAIAEPRAEVSQYAPKVIVFKINPEKIGDVIGSSGKIINKIIAEFEVAIDIEDDGTVMISGTDKEKLNQAKNTVENIARDFMEGEKITGTVSRVDDMRIFVKVSPMKEGGVHISDMSPFHLGRPSDLVKEGDKIMVAVKEVDERGRLNLTMKGLVENQPLWDKYKDTHKVEEKPERSGGYGGGRPQGQTRFKR